MSVAKILSSVRKEGIMRKIKFGSGFTIFLLFFGVALMEALQTNNWIKALFWLAIGIVFLAADNLNKGKTGM